MIKQYIIDIIMLILVWTFLVCVAPKTFKSPINDSPIIDYEEWIDTTKHNDSSFEDNMWIR